MNSDVKIISIRKWLTKHYISSLVIIIILLCLFNSLILSYSLANSNSVYVEQLLSETAGNVDLALQKVETVAAILNSNTSIQSLFSLLKNTRQSSDSIRISGIQQKLLKTITGITVADSSIANVAITDETDNMYLSADFNNLEEYPAFILGLKEDLKDSFNSCKWSSLHAMTKTTKVVTFHRYLVDNEKVSVLGHLFVSMNCKDIVSVLSQSKIGKSSYIYLRDADGQVIANSEKAPDLDELEMHHVHLLSDKTIVNYNGVAYYNKSKDLSNAPWSLVVYIPFRDIFQVMNTSLLSIIFIGVLSVICSIFLAVSMAGKITSPITRLQDGMLQIEGGNLNTVLEDCTFRETHTLGESINHMVRTVSHMTDQIAEEKLRKKEMELELLKAQINPHFIYNTLETVNLMLLIDGHKDLSNIITDLGDILRYSVGQSESEVLLGEDIDNINKYLNIQRFRYSSVHTYEVSISSEAGKCKILSMMIQPFVENALYHGMSGMKEHYKLTVRASVTDARLHITISDDGDGMPEEVVQSIMNAGKEIYSEASHIGTRNTIRRIYLFYGEKANVSIRSKPGEGTTLDIILPAVT